MNSSIKNVVTCALGVMLASATASAATVAHHAPALKTSEAKIEKVAYAAAAKNAHTQFAHGWN